MFSLSPARPALTQLAVFATGALVALLLPGLSFAQEIPAITDLRIENGELRWTAPANVARYGVQYYTGETTDRTQHFGGCAQAGMDRIERPGQVTSYCGWDTVSVTHSAGTTERLERKAYFSDPPPTYSYVVYSYNNAGQRSAVSNVAVYPTPIPPSLHRIADLRIENGELRWTAPANVARYGVQFYTGETTDRSQHFGGCQSANADYTILYGG